MVDIMLNRSPQNIRNRPTVRRNSMVAARHASLITPARKITAAVDSRRSGVVMPPETWHAPAEQRAKGYRIQVDEPGSGFRHVLTPEQIRERLAALPPAMLESLEVVHLSRMTRKKRSCPCYGMQWGRAIYLYPIEETRVENFHRPPYPSQLIEARMYGGVWKQAGRRWQLIWTEEAIQDYYLNNILIHELGHLVDERNNSTVDREQYAEWFAIAHGYLAQPRRRDPRQVTRRHG